MLLRVADLGRDDVFEFCIIGTGPAGIACLLPLLSSGGRIALLEGGSHDISPRSQSLYEGTTVGEEYFDLSVSRLRYFGGTSNHWNGRCRPLEAIDFAAKAEVAETAWPIPRAELEPYLAQASSVLEIPEIPPDRPLGSGEFRQVHFVRSPPVRFREKYFAMLTRRDDVAVVLNANVVALETDGRRTRGATVADYDGTAASVRAGAYVLAAGGIENSRLLLWSNALSNGALVRNAVTLGRYWMEHPEASVGQAVLIGDLAPAINRNRWVNLAANPALLEEEQMLSCNIALFRPKAEVAIETMADMARVAPEWARRASILMVHGGASVAAVRAAWEQQPLPENRIELSAERDALGVPKVTLHWRNSTTDLRTVRRTAHRFGEFLARENLGRLRLEPWFLTEADADAIPGRWAGNHHMGGTRMADSPAHGVVDRDCRVFGQENLYVAGSSVFPSAGYCNPTLTIVQLALRLGEHLRAKG